MGYSHDPYGGGSSYSSDPYGGSGGAKTSTKKKGRHGVLGFVENLGTDIGSAAASLGPGIYDAAKHLVAAQYYGTTGNQKRASVERAALIDPVVASYKQTYGPLAHGDVTEFGHRLYQHPLGPILDALSALSFGATTTARVARAAEAAGASGKTVQALGRLDKPGTITLRNPADTAEELGNATRVPRIESLSKPTSARPLRKAAQKALDAGLRALPGQPGEVVAIARFGRELRRNPDIRAQQLRLGLIDYTKAFAPLSRKERVALQVLDRLPLPKHVDEWKRMLNDVAQSGGPEAETAAGTLRLLADPEVERLYLNPSERMLKAHAAQDELGTKMSDLLGISPEQAQLSRFRHVRLVSGAVAYTAKDARRRITQLERDLRRTERTARTISGQAARLRGRGTPELTAAARQTWKTYGELGRGADSRARLSSALGSADQLEQAVAAARGDVERLAGGQALSSDELLAGGLRPGSDLSAVRTRLLGRRYDQLTRLAAQYDRALARVTHLEQRLPELPSTGRQSVEAARVAQARSDIASRLQAGRAELERLAAVEEALAGEQGLVRPGIVGGPDVQDLMAEIQAAGRPLPVYVPDTAQLNKRGMFGRGRGATSAPRSPVHRSAGMLFRIGQLALEPDVLSPEYLRSVVYAHYTDLHDALLEAARPVFRGDTLGDGEVWVRRLPGERIGYAEQTRGVHRKSIQELVPDPSKPHKGQLAELKLTSGDEGDALLDHGRRYAVPERLARRFESEFSASHTAAGRFLQNFTTVWRALVLGLRVGFLTNNIVGNHLLFALRYAGPAGIHAYINAIRREHGDSVAGALLRRHPLPAPQRRAFMEEHFPEQVAGNLIDTQLPNTRTGRVARKLSLGLVPADRAVEQTLRRAAVEVELRKSPEFRRAARELAGSKLVKAMPSQTREFETIAHKALAENPDLQRRVSNSVNDALGDFLSLSEFEKRTVRAFFPFYAWYRAITLIVGRLALDNPLRADILAKLSEIGAQTRNDQLGPLPSFLQGAIPIGGDRLINSGGLNPIGTIAGEGQALRALGPGATPEQVQALVGMSNPLLGGALAEYKRATDRSYGRAGGSAYGIPGDILAAIGQALPQYRLGRAAIGKAPDSKLYTNSALERELSSFLGIPLREINRAIAAEQARQGR